MFLHAEIDSGMVSCPHNTQTAQMKNQRISTHSCYYISRRQQESRLPRNAMEKKGNPFDCHCLIIQNAQIIVTQVLMP